MRLAARSAIGSVLALALTACGNRGPERTLEIHGVRFTTAMPSAVAVICDTVDAGGKATSASFGMLGNSAGVQTVGSALPPDTNARLRIGVAADVWQVAADGKATLLVSKDLQGLAGATIGDGTLELRGAAATFEIQVSSGGESEGTLDFELGQVTFTTRK